MLAGKYGYISVPCLIITDFDNDSTNFFPFPNSTYFLGRKNTGMIFKFCKNVKQWQNDNATVIPVPTQIISNIIPAFMKENNYGTINFCPAYILFSSSIPFNSFILDI